MRRRSFLASLAAFFGFGGDAVARERETAFRLDRTAAADDMPVATPTGHIFRCENGHPCCEAIANLILGDHDWHAKIGNWRDRKPPKPGDPFPTCLQCGGQIVFWRNERGINR